MYRLSSRELVRRAAITIFCSQYKFISSDDTKKDRISSMLMDTVHCLPTDIENSFLGNDIDSVLTRLFELKLQETQRFPCSFRRRHGKGSVSLFSLDTDH